MNITGNKRDRTETVLNKPKKINEQREKLRKIEAEMKGVLQTIARLDREKKEIQKKLRLLDPSKEKVTTKWVLPKISEAILPATPSKTPIKSKPPTVSPKSRVKFYDTLDVLTKIHQVSNRLKQKWIDFDLWSNVVNKIVVDSEKYVNMSQAKLSTEFSYPRSTFSYNWRLLSEACFGLDLPWDQIVSEDKIKAFAYMKEYIDDTYVRIC